MPRADYSSRDIACIERMLKYCEQTKDAIDGIENSKERFLESHIHQNAVAMCILQLGELTKQLTYGFIQDHPEIPWSLIAKTRDQYAHHYGNMDFEQVWVTATQNVPELKAFCENFLAR